MQNYYFKDNLDDALIIAKLLLSNIRINICILLSSALIYIKSPIK